MISFSALRAQNTKMAANVDMRNDQQEAREDKQVLDDVAGPLEGEPVNDEEDEFSAGFTLWLVITAVTCFLGSSFQFGYNLGVINAPKDVSIYLIGPRRN